MRVQSLTQVVALSALAISPVFTYPLFQEVANLLAPRDQSWGGPWSDKKFSTILSQCNDLGSKASTKSTTSDTTVPPTTDGSTTTTTGDGTNTSGDGTGTTNTTTTTTKRSLFERSFWDVAEELEKREPKKPDFRKDPCNWLQYKGFMKKPVDGSTSTTTTGTTVADTTTGSTTTGSTTTGSTTTGSTTTGTNSTTTPDTTTTTAKIKRAMIDFGGMMEGVLGG